MGYKMSGPSLYPNIQRSSHGYRKGHTDSKSKIIPGDKSGTTISMKEEDGAPLEKGSIEGTGLTTGKKVVMKPGETHVFKGDSEVLETPLAQKKSKAKYRKDGTLKKVVTKDKETGYKSKIKFDKTGRIKSAKNNRTKNKHKKSKQRLSQSKWVKDDMAEITEEHFPTVEKKEKVTKTAEEIRNETYNRT